MVCMDRIAWCLILQYFGIGNFAMKTEIVQRFCLALTPLAIFTLVYSPRFNLLFLLGDLLMPTKITWKWSLRYVLVMQLPRCFRIFGSFRTWSSCPLKISESFTIIPTKDFENQTLFRLQGYVRGKTLLSVNHLGSNMVLPVWFALSLYKAT